MATETKSCTNCGWWERDTDLDCGGAVDYGLCARALGPRDNKNNYGPGKDTRNSPMIVEDGEQYSASLYTDKDHVCSEWCIEKPKAEKEKEVPFVSMIQQCKQEMNKDGD